MGWTLTALKKGRPLTKHLQSESSPNGHHHPPPGVCEVSMLIWSQEKQEHSGVEAHHPSLTRQQSYKVNTNGCAEGCNHFNNAMALRERFCCPLESVTLGSLEDTRR
ncbi:hypothetical protein TNCT_483111 [Trichonephila clavata]|uniref:Uncharacterized protein n=1 Tax=Trichonephila clavata TaxID=2740835 RepID=A0A8X6L472_TRICU|nr:hypothetical protein TNCT_483111 [Trichonephila clavata]